LSFVKANISELVEDTYSNFKPLAEQKSLYFKLNLPKESLQASIDLDAFNKIMNNLFSNLIKYAEKKAIVRLSSANAADHHFTVEFVNDGPLVPMEMSEKI